MNKFLKHIDDTMDVGGWAILYLFLSIFYVIGTPLYLVGLLVKGIRRLSG